MLETDSSTNEGLKVNEEQDEKLIYLKVDDCYLDCVSKFRIAIDLMNSNFMDLIRFDKELTVQCREIVMHNHKFIKDMIFGKELTHSKMLDKIEEFKTGEYDQLLKDLLEKINVNFENFNKKDESPINEQFKYKEECLKNKFEKFQDALKKYQENIGKSKNIYDDFVETKINPLFSNDSDDDNDDDNDEDEGDNNNKRSYGNPWPNIPREIQKSVNMFLSYVNSLISIKSILDFDKVISDYKDKAQKQQEKIDKEKEEEEILKQKAIEDEKRRKIEEEREALRQIYLAMEPEELEKKVKDLQEQEKTLITNVEELKNTIEELQNEEEKLRKGKEDQTNQLEKLKEDNESLLKQQDELTNSLNNKDKEIKNLLNEVSQLKAAFDQLKKILLHQ